MSRDVFCLLERKGFVAQNTKIGGIYTILLGQWLNFTLFWDDEYLVGKINRSNFFFQGPQGEFTPLEFEDFTCQVTPWTWTLRVFGDVLGPGKSRKMTPGPWMSGDGFVNGSNGDG